MQDARLGEQRMSPRFGSPSATARPSSAQQRQAKSVAAHIANMRRRASFPDRTTRLSNARSSIPLNRANPLLGGHAKESAREQADHQTCERQPPATHQRQPPRHARTPSFEKGLDASVASLTSGATEGHLHELDDLEESDEDISTFSGSPCTELNARVGALCDKAENLVQEMSSVMTPPHPPPHTSLTTLPLPQPKCELQCEPQCELQCGLQRMRRNTGDSSQKLSTLKIPCTPHTCSTRTDDFLTLTPVSSTYSGTPGAATSPSTRGKGREE